MSDEESSNLKFSHARAKQAKTHPRIDGDEVRDFSWHTGQWVWWPVVRSQVYFGWNPTGGPAKTVFHKQTYWLCLGWSLMKELVDEDRVWE
jgi:hypothetical protein